ncbi:hypothetical protein Tco_0771562 [Tanacetum coccineum]|uniref:Uncharacterized protein n=1 Tax=Tanacetum coccineum TaxID=301880 RepID=A0ABQ4ZGR3_9ASTR
MHTSTDDYLINTLRFVSVNEESQIYGARLPESITISLEEPTRKSKRVKRPAKKATNAPTTVALTEEAQYEEVHKKSLRDFHKTHPSGSGIVTSAAKMEPSVINEGTGVKYNTPCFQCSKELIKKSSRLGFHWKLRFSDFVMSDLEHSTITYTSISSDADPLAWAIDFFGLQEPESLEAVPSSPDYVPVKEQPLPAAVSPTAGSPGYITESDLEEDPEEDDEDPKEDPTDYPADRDDDDDEEKESSGDDADDEEEDKDEDEEEDEEHLAPVDSVLPPVHRTTTRMSIQDQTPTPFPSEAEVDRLLAISTPLSSPLTSYSSPLP